MKKGSSRSQRGSKGIKGKHVLQICVLLGVCIWLLYQVKYSHDKKKEFYEKDGEKSRMVSEIEDRTVKLGRKDLLPGYRNQKEKHVEEDEDEEEISHGGEEKESKVENVNLEEEEEKEEEEEAVEEDEEDKNKQGDEVGEEDEEENKHVEDEIDEQDHSKTVGDTDEDDESLEEEKESGINESDETEKETNHADETDMTVDEAREEHYKADDASSAVSHEYRILNSEKLKESSNETVQENNPNNTTSQVEILNSEKLKESSNETVQENNRNNTTTQVEILNSEKLKESSNETVQENNRNNTTTQVEIQKEADLKLGEEENAGFVNKITTEVKDGDSDPSGSEAKSTVTESQGDAVNGNSTEAILEASAFLQNETDIMRDRNQEDGAPPARFSEPPPVVELEQLHNDTNITVSANITNKDSIQDEPRNSTLESYPIENLSGSNTTEVKEESRSEVDDELAEKESSNVFSTEEADNTSETTISQEEMDALTDPQTLPDIRIEGNEEDEEETLGTQ